MSVHLAKSDSALSPELFTIPWWQSRRSRSSRPFAFVGRSRRLLWIKDFNAFVKRLIVSIFFLSKLLFDILFAFQKKFSRLSQNSAKHFKRKEGVQTKITTNMFKNISNSWNFWLFNWCQSWPSLIYGFVDLFWLMLINFSSYTVFAFFWELSCIIRYSVEQDCVCGNIWFIVPSFWNLLCCSCRFFASANILQFEVRIEAISSTVIFIVGL